MYIPNHFREEPTERLLAFMRRNSFATVVSVLDGSPVATHLPITVAQAGDEVTLRGHFAKANPHWRALEHGETLVIFTGPHAYVSPAHYEKRESVPTWNYLAVHAYGEAKAIDGAAALAGLHDLIAEHEAAYREQFDSLPDRYREGMLKGIVGFEMRVTRLEGAAKLSQNKSRQERSSIAVTLARSDDGAARLTGEEMLRLLDAETHDLSD